MLLYEDIITGDELFSDAFPMYAFSRLSVAVCSQRFRKEIDGIVYEVDCQMITVKAGADVDIGGTLIYIAYIRELTSFSRC